MRTADSSGYLREQQGSRDAWGKVVEKHVRKRLLMHCGEILAGQCDSQLTSNASWCARLGKMHCVRAHTSEHRRVLVFVMGLVCEPVKPGPGVHRAMRPVEAKVENNLPHHRQWYEQGSIQQRTGNARCVGLSQKVMSRRIPEA
jgi:hypothetical protein